MSRGEGVERSFVTFLSDCMWTFPGFTVPRSLNFCRHVKLLSHAYQILFESARALNRRTLSSISTDFLAVSISTSSSPRSNDSKDRLLGIGLTLRITHSREVTRRRETVRAKRRFIVPSFPLKHLGWLPADVAIGRSTWLFRDRILNYLAPSAWLCAPR